MRSLDGLDVVGDVLPRAAVAAGQCPHQPALLVEEVDREPVDLELAQVVVAGRAGVAGDPRRPRGKLLGREAVVEGQHPLEVVDRREVGGEDRATHLLGRALGRAQLGELLLQLVEPADHPVVVAVADRRRISDVVAEPVILDLLRQLGVPGADVVRAHAAKSSGRLRHCDRLPGPAERVGDQKRNAQPGRHEAEILQWKEEQRVPIGHGGRWFAVSRCSTCSAIVHGSAACAGRWGSGTSE